MTKSYTSLKIISSVFHVLYGMILHGMTKVFLFFAEVLFLKFFYSLQHKKGMGYEIVEEVWFG